MLAVLTDEHMDLNKRMYHDPLFPTISEISGIYIVMTVSRYIGKSQMLRSVFLPIESASLFLLIFHYLVQATAYKLLRELLTHEVDLIIAAFSCLLNIVVPLLIKRIVSKNKFLSLFYLPMKFDTSLHQVRNAFP